MTDEHSNETRGGIPASLGVSDVQKIFAKDRFATEALGARIVEARRGYARCEVDIDPRLFNAAGSVMGGAIFTLADFALAVACNIGEPATVSVSNTIEFMSAPKGTVLTAECTADKSGRSLGFYTSDVFDDLGTPVAKMTATCFRK